jgi:cell division protein FtsQ
VAARPPAGSRALSARLHAALPSARVLLIGWSVAALAGGAYALARETSLFAVERLDVSGAPPVVAAQVRAALADVRGKSLVGLDGGAVLDRVDAIPRVAGARYDRAFPHTLRILVQPERPVAVLRTGSTSWLVSAGARVLDRLRAGARPDLPRIWVPAGADLAVGQTLDASTGGAAARALAPLVGRFPVRITAVTLAHDELSFTLAGRLELRFGQPDDLRLKLAVARRILGRLPAGTTYLDLSVPERPVAGDNPQLSGRA